MSPTGIKTWLPSDVKKQEFVSKILVDLFVETGYEPISIPTLVDIDVVAKANAKFSSEFFKLVDRDGKTLALRTEITQPIAKAVVSRSKELKFPLKLYYNSTVFRYKGIATDDSREIQQIGIEYFTKDKDSSKADQETIELLLEAMKRLELTDYQITVTDAKIWRAIFAKYGNRTLEFETELELTYKTNIKEDELSLAARLYKALYRSDIIAAKNILKSTKELKILLEKNNLNKLSKLLNLDLSSLETIIASDPRIVFDATQCPELKLYTGLHFNVSCSDEGKVLCAGGRYDKLCKDFGKELNAIGFAFYLPKLLSVLFKNDLLDGNKKQQKAKKKILRIAVSKGTLLDGALDFLKDSGLEFKIAAKQRKLIVEAQNPQWGFDSIQIMLVRGHDVPIYVDHGAADLGIVGSDAVIDSKTDVVKVKDLKYGECKLCVCAIKDAYKSITDLPSQIRVATTFPNIAKDYFNKLGLDVEIINLYGSVELGPLVDLSDVIVDLVATGATLAENNLEVIETIMNCSSTLIANQVSFKLYRNKIPVLG